MPLIERVLDRTECASLDEHRRRGGGEGLYAARRVEPSVVIELIADSGLRGRGGAGFPTGRKWATIAAAVSDRPPTVVVNAAEGEPATFKDRQLLRMNPYKVLEGALIAAHAVGAGRVVVATKSTFRRELAALRRAIDDLDAEDWSAGVQLEVAEGPSEYLFGEETALLEVLSGRGPFPRVAPPYRRGVEPRSEDLVNSASNASLVGDEPGADPAALVDNVETLANVPAILARGATWFRSIGSDGSPGSIVCTMSGACRTHAVGEVPMGTTLRDAIDLIGEGPAHGRVVGALSGVANAIVPEELLDTPLTYEAMADIGSGLGAGGFLVLDDRTDVASVAASASRFLAVESCGQCEPCKRDGRAIARRLASIDGPTPDEDDAAQLPDRLSTVADGARCALATQHQVVVTSLLERFPDEFTPRPGGRDGTAVEVLPIVDIVDGRAVLDTTHLAKQPDWTFDEHDSGTAPVDLWPRDAMRPPTQVVERNQRSSAALAGPRDGVPAAIQPLVELTDDLRQDLDRVLAGDDRSRALHSLRRRLDTYVDVERRIVHPWAERVAPGEGDDLSWDAELDELRTEHLAALDDERPADEPAVAELVERLRSIIDGDEARILALLEDRMDDQELDELGAGVAEVLGTSRTD
jgi:NADH:ubiquinone oxidoreductase subunit F (NADH-binding)